MVFIKKSWRNILDVYKRQYLIGYRLQAASWLLKNTNKKVKTIAYESGFHNVDYFCRLFKKRYHLTPSEYRCTCLKLLSADPSLRTHKSVSYTHLDVYKRQGLRIGEACGLAWQDVNLEEQCLTIRRSIRYDGSKRKYIIGPTKRKKVRVVDLSLIHI